MRARVAEGRGRSSLALARGLQAGFNALRQALTALRLRRETIMQLRALSDRELKDIGLNRGAILSAAGTAPANDQGSLDRAA
jgi:uncharacterized protein YjiS (DUF1127 family)